MRPVVDHAVLQLIDTVTFTGADFSIQHDGICRMNPELARRVAQLALERCSTQGNRQHSGGLVGQKCQLALKPTVRGLKVVANGDGPPS
jgi:hypothetical protein